MLGREGRIKRGLGEEGEGGGRGLDRCVTSDLCIAVKIKFKMFVLEFTLDIYLLLDPGFILNPNQDLVQIFLKSRIFMESIGLIH